jgi:hypothetical protein
LGQLSDVGYEIFINPNIEIRNSKQIRNTNVLMSKTPKLTSAFVLNFVLEEFEFV